MGLRHPVPPVARLFFEAEVRTIFPKRISKVSFTCSVEWIGRAAARRSAPKLPRAIRVGPNKMVKKIGRFFREFIHPGVYPFGSLSTREFIRLGGLSI